MKKYLILTCVLFIAFSQLHAQSNKNIDRATSTMDSVYKYFSISESKLLREQYPFQDDYVAGYLGGGENSNKSNPYSYLWPFSGSLSAQVAIYEASKSKVVKKAIDDTVLTGLASYYDLRSPAGYASYVNTASPSDRFYDDNIWLGIDYTDLYLLTKEKQYLAKSEEIWKFVASGMDDKLGGGIYWCEQRKESKNTCSNAPAIVHLAKLYQATKNKSYLKLAIDLYQWTQTNLMDKDDYVYFDNINLSGKVDKRKYPYNSGQMIQAAALLYKITKEKQYLTDAQNVAKGSYEHFFFDYQVPTSGKEIKLLKTSDNWFIAVMMRGFVELYHLDNNKEYINAFQANLDYAWENMREANGLFNKDWTGKQKREPKWLLDQFAIAEMYGKLGTIK